MIAPHLFYKEELFMTGKAYTACIQGVNGRLVEVEADVMGGIPGFELTGNLSGIVKESKERVRLAIRNSKVKLNPAKVIINLAPARIRKEGAHYDLAIAISVLCATGILEKEINDTLLIGELALDGRILPIKGVLPMIDIANKMGLRRCIVPKDNVGEGTLIKGIEVLGAETLRECIDFFRGNGTLYKKDYVSNAVNEENTYDYNDIIGQEGLKRGVLIAASAMHNILMIGPPGAGKTMAAMRIDSIMPPLSEEQVIDISRIYSVAGLIDSDRGYINHRPFRSPNYTITATAMTGGGLNPIPGEMSLAQYGVLFLDELNLFKPEVIETLRIPLETKVIKLNRASGTYEYPADFMLVAAINPCKCGYYPDRERCNCTEKDIRQHMGKISRPIIDRIDICVEAPKVEYKYISAQEDNYIYSSAYMRDMVLKVHSIQQDRFISEKYKFNSKIPINDISKFCPMEKDAEMLLKTVYERYNLTLRAYHKIIKVARTIADLEEHEVIMLPDVGEAVGYRMTEVIR